MATWRVIHEEEDGPWVVRRDGTRVSTAPGHYDAWEVLAMVERRAGDPLLWRLIQNDASGGFESTDAASQ